MNTVLCLAFGIGLFSPRIQTVSETIEQISVRSQKQIKVSAELAKLRIYVDFKDRSPDQSLRILAGAISASVKSTADGLFLSRSLDDHLGMTEHVGKVRETWIDARIKSIEEFRVQRLHGDNVLEAFKKATDGATNDPNSETPILRDANGGTHSTVEFLPAEKLLIDLVNRIGVRTMARLPTFRTSVFEDAPHGSAKSLPSHGDLDAVYRNSVGRQLPRRNEILDIIPEDRGERLPYILNNKVASKLRLEQFCDGTTISIKLEGFDAAGQRVLSAFMGCGANRSLVAPSAHAIRASEIHGSDWIDLSKDAQNALTWPRENRSQVPEWFIHPEKVEPLNFHVREAIEGLRKTESDSAPFVFIVSDSLWTTLKGCVRDGRMNVAGIISTIQDWSPYERIETANGVVWRPIDLSLAESFVADRAELGKYSREVIRQRRIDMRTASKMVSRAARNAYALPGEWNHLAQVLFPEVRSPGTTLEFGQLIGAIDDSHWAQLQQGKSFTVAELGIDPFVRKVLEDDPNSKTISDFTHPDIMDYPNETLSGQSLGKLTVRGFASSISPWRQWSDEGPEPDGWSFGETLETALAAIPFQVFSGTNPTKQLRTQADFERMLEKRRFRRGQAESNGIIIDLPNGFYIKGSGRAYVEAEPDSFKFANLSVPVRNEIWKLVSERSSKEATDAFRRRLTEPARPSKVIKP